MFLTSRSLFSFALKSFFNMLIDCLPSEGTVVSRVCVTQVYPECLQEHHPLTPLTVGLGLSLLSLLSVLCVLCALSVLSPVLSPHRLIFIM